MDDGPVWADPDASRRFGAVLARVMVMPIVVVVTVPLVVGLLIGQRRLDQERDDELAFIAVVASTSTM